MADVFRYVGGDTKARSFPTYSSDAIEQGDLLYWDATNNAARNAETVGGADYATKKTNFANAFIGVAMEAKPAGTSRNILVAAAGDFLYDCPSGAEYDVTDMLAVGNGSAVADQTVVKDATAGNMIGRVLKLKAGAATTVLVRLVSKLA